MFHLSKNISFFSKVFKLNFHLHVTLSIPLFTIICMRLALHSLQCEAKHLVLVKSVIDDACLVQKKFTSFEYHTLLQMLHLLYLGSIFPHIFNHDLVFTHISLLATAHNVHSHLQSLSIKILNNESH